ncbi:MAG: copper amine oxidase N-terminal domain-containing protein [Firmicutes bacterium]|nr:copper amine oxidase N-terminal domain-containing protein [Bacillota bacterium]
MKKYLFLPVSAIGFWSLSISVLHNRIINAAIDGQNVVFDQETGYPFVDENNRTMVPLRVTMETAGFDVGYDSQKKTAVVATPENRIEIPVGEAIFM